MAGVGTFGKATLEGCLNLDTSNMFAISLQHKVLKGKVPAVQKLARKYKYTQLNMLSSKEKQLCHPRAI
eukprot:297470-Pelagomonas_calceolata.AAC.2